MVHQASRCHGSDQAGPERTQGRRRGGEPVPMKSSDVSAAEKPFGLEVAVTEDPLDEELNEEEAAPSAGDFLWDEEESEALRQARKDAALAVSADSVRAYLKQIGKV